jgi:hypothetical protein
MRHQCPGPPYNLSTRYRRHPNERQEFPHEQVHGRDEPSFRSYVHSGAFLQGTGGGEPTHSRPIRSAGSDEPPMLPPGFRGSFWSFCENPNGTCGAFLENLATVRLQS